MKTIKARITVLRGLHGKDDFPLAETVAQYSPDELLPANFIGQWQERANREKNDYVINWTEHGIGGGQDYLSATQTQ